MTRKQAVFEPRHKASEPSGWKKQRGEAEGHTSDLGIHPIDKNVLFFYKVNERNFATIKLRHKINQYSSAPIIINASNEVLVDQFLRKKIEFLDIIKIIMRVLKDKNFKKYAIKKPKKIDQIYQIDHWARSLTMKKLN